MRISARQVIAGLTLAMFSAQWSGAQETSDDEGRAAEPVLEEIVVVGTRREGAQVHDLPVPVDVVSGDDLVNQGASDLDDLLRTTTLSYNVQRHGIDDEATMVRPATLRGLPPDSALVLVNEKRRHRSGVIAFLGSSLNSGSQGPDIFVIPAIAIDHIEILRDGASAQYGSDAIAGVINFELKEAAQGGMLEARYGEYFEGDGGLTQVAGNLGLPFGDRGFLNLSAEYKTFDPTVRAVQRANADALAAQGYPVADPAQIWGNPVIDDAITTFYNMAAELPSGNELYSFGNYSTRTSEGGFFFRAPGGSAARNGVFRTGSRRLVADLNPNDAVDCLATVPGLEADFSTVNAFVQSTRGACFLFNELFPGGFTPRFGADIADFSVTAGLRGELTNGLSWDVSVSSAESDVAFFMRNTINASLGPATPTNFKPRVYTQNETNVNLDLVYPLEVGGLYSPLNVAAGLEWRNEEFETAAGDPDSYRVGPYADGRISSSFSIGSNGFQGLNPRNAGKWDRPNYAAYVDLEADLTAELLMGFALRYEDFYDDFGTTVNGKLSARWRASDAATLRGTVSTGFRAPSPGQSNVSVLSTTFSGLGGLQEVGKVPPTNPVAQALGGKALQEETSVGYSVGLTYEFSDAARLRIDIFRIEIDDRISPTGDIRITNQIAGLLEASGLAAGSGVTTINFLTNDFDTITTGVDLALNYSFEALSGESELTLAWNWTKTELDHFSPPFTVTEVLGTPLDQAQIISLLSDRRRTELEDMNPPYRFAATWDHAWGSWRLLARGSYYAGWDACRFQSAGCAALDSWGGDFLVDAELSYDFAGGYTATAGAQNLFDVSPDAVQAEALGQGNAKPASAPYDYNGGFIYFRVSYRF